MKQSNDSQKWTQTLNNRESDCTFASPDNGIVEMMAKRVVSLVTFLLNHSTFAFGFCAIGVAPFLYLVHPTTSFIALAMGVGAVAGKIGKLLDRRA